ncbi:hypothetical protein ALC56_08094 [Trachymyrmex septentrionalis]|uniref:Uncharacterized protein n=1 Tax=Trachymyrmex septentrionalis TaxID=34720 RepID=A0A151JVU7_9HYME|nr:hypothetical protein ALC56_08094 [Trachymyrmex septentrionalis]
MDFWGKLGGMNRMIVEEYRERFFLRVRQKTWVKEIEGEGKEVAEEMKVFEAEEDKALDVVLSFVENLHSFIRNVTQQNDIGLTGEVNRHNCRYWNNENPHWMIESHLQHPQKFNIFFPNRWIERRDPTEWPPQSSDLALLDYIFWRYLKNKVCIIKPNDLDNLCRRIVNETRYILQKYHTRASQ